MIEIERVCFFRFGGGLIMDIKRKAKCYKADFVDAFNSQCLASVLFIYFACLAPIVTFGGVMETKTNKYMVRDREVMSNSHPGFRPALKSIKYMMKKHLWWI